MEDLKLHSSKEEMRPRKCYNRTRLFLIVDSKTPIVMKLSTPPQLITLKHFHETVSLKKDQYKFYFKARDPEYGSIKEEVVADDCYLPYEGDKIVVWAISQDNSGSNRNNERRFTAGNSAYDKSSSSSHESSPSRGSKNIIVYLHLDQFNFLGLTLIGQNPVNSNNEKGGLYVAGIAKQSVAEENGLIELGDKLIEINDINLEGLANDTAIAIIQSLVHKRGSITIQVSRGKIGSDSGKLVSLPSLSSPVNSNRFNLSPHTPRGFLDYRITDLYTIYLVLKKDSQNLRLKSYDWLGFSITNAFLGSSLINWLRRNVQGFKSKEMIKRFALELLKSNLIKSPVANNNFSERCFYTLN